MAKGILPHWGFGGGKRSKRRLRYRPPAVLTLIALLLIIALFHYFEYMGPQRGQAGLSAWTSCRYHPCPTPPSTGSMGWNFVSTAMSSCRRVARVSVRAGAAFTRRVRLIPLGALPAFNGQTNRQGVKQSRCHESDMLQSKNCPDEGAYRRLGAVVRHEKHAV